MRKRRCDSAFGQVILDCDQSLSKLLRERLLIVFWIDVETTKEVNEKLPKEGNVVQRTD
jgi:hypothetical protein